MEPLLQLWKAFPKARVNFHPVVERGIFVSVTIPELHEYADWAQPDKVQDVLTAIGSLALQDQKEPA